jgi:hypothetical protein
MSKRFANYAPKSVAGNGFSDGSGGNGHAESGTWQLVGVNRETEMGIPVAGALTVSGFKLDFAQHPCRGWEAQGHG